MSDSIATSLDALPDPEVFFAGEPQNPVLPLPTKVEFIGLLQTIGANGIREMLAKRRERILAGEREPLVAPRPKLWRIAQRVLARKEMKILVLLGGNRSTKSFFCADALMRSAMRSVDYNQRHGYSQPTIFTVGSDSEVNSINTTQALIWHFLPQRFKELNQAKTQREKRLGLDVNYTPGDGFGDRTLALGYGVVVKFVLYSNDSANFEGSEFGAKDYRDVSWWMDESLTLPWLAMLRRRGRFRPGYGLWSFTPVRGITPAIKSAVGDGRVERTRRASLLPDNIELIRGMKPGRVPFVQRGSMPDTSVVYFHSDLTPFSSGGQKYADTVAADCEGKPPAYVLRIFYGHTTDTVGLAFPTFSRKVHVVRQEMLPSDGTNYLFMDPAGDRNWFMVWVRVAPGNPRRVFIYREWPDYARYGEWAVTSERQASGESRKGWDGDPGPAQQNLGWGVSQYKRQILDDETVGCFVDRDGRVIERDPYRVRILENASKPGIRREARREEVRVRKIDPRAGKNPFAAEDGGTNLIDLFAARQDDGGEFGAPMEILPAYTGRGIDDGFTHVNELLVYRRNQPLCPFINEPKLFVAENCHNVIWMFENYTGHGGETGACKDPADLVRYIAQDQELIHLSPEAMQTRPGVTY